MILITKEWKGSSIEKDLSAGAEYLKRLILDISPCMKIHELSENPQSGRCDFDKDINIKHMMHYGERISRAKEILIRNKPEKVFHIGGGCAMDFAPISYLKKIYPEMKVIWFDAHGDLNNPETSPNGYIHGMALGLLLHGKIFSELPVLQPDDVRLAFTKELDEAENFFISEKNIKTIGSTAELNLYIKKDCNNTPLYIHVDFDVFHPDDCGNMKCVSESGLKISELTDILGIGNYNQNIKGISLLENTELSNPGIENLIHECLKISGD